MNDPVVIRQMWVLRTLVRDLFVLSVMPMTTRTAQRIIQARTQINVLISSMTANRWDC